METTIERLHYLVWKPAKPLDNKDTFYYPFKKLMK